MNSLDIYDTFNTPLERFIKSRVDDSDVAADLLQDVYVKIHTHLGSLQDDQRLRAWVYQIARNTVYDHYRMKKPLVALEDIFEASEDDERDDMTERLALSLKNMMVLLPDEYREALTLTEFEGYSQKELAEYLGISLSGAKSRVQRGRKMLKQLFLQCCHVQFDRVGKVIDYHPHCEQCDGQTCAS